MPTLNEQLVASHALEDAQDAARMKPALYGQAQIEPTPMGIIQLAVMQGAAIDTIERLVKLQTDMVERDAKVEFYRAMQLAQSQMRRVGVDATNPQTRSKYATYAKLDGALRPVYTEHGFSLSFDTGDSGSPDIVRVICDVSHKAGHTRTYKIDMPADGKGAKGGDVMTKTHATGAAMSYGMRYLLKMIFNVAVGETDDDGNGASGKGELPLDEFDRLCELISSAETVEDLKSRYQSACRYANSKGDEGAIREFEKRKNVRYREIGK